MIPVVRVLFVLVAAAIFYEWAFPHRTPYRVLDPDQPIAADGSMTAGRARTIYDTDPAYRAARQAAEGDRDDPANFASLIKIESTWADRERAAMKSVMGPLDWSRCDDRKRSALLIAVRSYFETRERELRSFALRGPQAKAAIEREWSTPADRAIDDYVRHAVQYGIVHKSEMPAQMYPEFNRLFGDVQELGAGCPPLKNDKAAANR